MSKVVSPFFYKKTIVSLILVSVLFSFPLSAFAQLGGLMANGGGTLSSSINLNGVGAIALNCASSSGALGGANSPFGTTAGAIGSSVGGVAGTYGGGVIGEAIGGEEGEQIGQVVGGIAGAIGGAFLGNSLAGGGPNTGASPATAVTSLQTVPVSDATTQSNTSQINSEASQIKKEEKEETKKEQCLDRIAQWAAITVMDRMTLAILNWINSGFKGNGPFYMENGQNFFANIAKEELLGFSATFSGDANLYPFGDTIVRTLILSYQRPFQQVMINNMNSILNGSLQEWEGNFSVGGWGAYTAFVEPNNNIFGAYIESSRNLGRRLEGTQVSTAINIQQELQRSGGFFSDQICVETENGGAYIPESSIQHIKVGVAHITQINQIPTDTYTYITACEFDDIFDENGDGDPDSDGLCEGFDEDVIEVAEDFRGRSNCIQWRTRTPGTLIAQSASDALGASQDQLLLVDELNENIGLILDAFILQFLNEGLEAFTDDNENSVLVQQVNGENPGAQTNTVDFIDAINGFNEGGQDSFAGLIPLQQEYIDGVQTLLLLQEQIMQHTLDLDYCVPGPNPAWQATSAQAIADFFNQLPAYENLPQEAWAQSTPGIFGGLAEDIAGLPITINPQELYEYITLIYSGFIQIMTGVSFNYEAIDTPLVSKNSHLLPILYSAFNEYANLINERFILADDFDNDVRELSSDFFFNLTNVQQSYVAYQQSLELVSDTLEQLIELREEYAQIEYQYIIDELTTAVNEQGIQTLADNLATFQSFSGNEITYIGVDGQNSAYHNAVITLQNELGLNAIQIPTNDPEYNDILEEFVDLIPTTVTGEYLDNVNDEIEIALEDLGNPSDANSLIGLTVSCVQQVNESGPYLGFEFTGYTERKPYPFPISETVGGFPFASVLDTTDTFLEDLTVTAEEDGITIMLEPEDEVDEADNVGTFESMFINIGNSLY